MNTDQNTRQNGLVGFENLLGEWVGDGEMTVGEHTGIITETLSIELTDVEDCVSYIRKSSIDFAQRTTLHNELGYIKPESTNLLLSRSSYIIMEWDESSQLYRQVTGSSDSNNMTREIIFSIPSKMLWKNTMDVNHGGHWVTHTADTKFLKIAS